MAILVGALLALFDDPLLNFEWQLLATLNALVFANPIHLRPKITNHRVPNNVANRLKDVFHANDFFHIPNCCRNSKINKIYNKILDKYTFFKSKISYSGLVFLINLLYYNNVCYPKIDQILSYNSLSTTIIKKH